ncbi:Class II abasic (AP) endonuclease [Friedmanniomyces endolithicus]|uniref:DNA-(apurinic or apyrimidinic site) endonuclease 2 n=1 Tax=Friedmanniomyces endolithicus TaxID=329885 RepID=A0AAN6R2K9_9PEZI|nr:Class II abasic (AP) endonuclease [Friedmanniomyces endolithicus]KAK0797423.1 Class II abasic (AP) endonuclease [Friedmanniomyces endolithicus]KAK0807449.1 Class II abasic (AP) endonuclease [Friedmanniomyces endolithicus]KAK0809257.1 Class II abasic (AP) endonuclease [Friedmanniomyces endolithicus]KAK0842264.1 Class II abasic (AP) endonuclease [Friedmanniomyces endolithicus]
MRLTTWNVNGIRNPFSYQPWNSARTFPAMFDILGSDIVVMQELKIQRKDLRDDMVLLDGWDCYFSLPKHKKGYSGIGMYTRNATCSPIRAEEGLLGVLPSPSGVPYCELPEEESIGGYPSAFQIAELGIDPAELDAEGRCLVLEFPAFVLLGVYSPANSNGMRDDFRYGFICSLDCRIRNLTRAGKRVVLVGDLNVSRDELDGASALEDIRKAAITHEEYISTPNRRIFNQLLIGGEVIGPRDDGREEGVLWDTTRGLHPYRKGMYTHWEQKINARPGNFGSRIDFVLVCESMQPWVKDANTQEGLLGSDHCPVYVDFHDTVQSHGNEVSLIDEMSPPGVFHDGARMKEWKVLDVPPFSGKRLPEFDKRRSIKSMFAAPSLRQPSSSALEPFIKPSSPVKQQAVADPAPANHDFPQLSSTAPESIGITASPALKRKASVSAKLKPSKRQKSDTPALAAKGQQSMKGFLSKGKANATELPTRTAGEEQQTNQRFTTPEPPATPTASAPSLPDTATTADQHPLPTTAPPSAPASPTPSTLSAFTDASPSSFTAHAASISATQKTWSTLFSRPIAPLCEGHSEPCKTMQTKKKGSNQGRSFWMCARPLGPSGGKEKGTQWRCGTFVWGSEWQGRRGEERVGEGG